MDIIFPVHQRQYYMEKIDQNLFYSTRLVEADEEERMRGKGFMEEMGSTVP